MCADSIAVELLHRVYPIICQFCGSARHQAPAPVSLPVLALFPLQAAPFARSYIDTLLS